MGSGSPSVYCHMAREQWVVGPYNTPLHGWGAVGTLTSSILCHTDGEQMPQGNGAPYNRSSAAHHAKAVAECVEGLPVPSAQRDTVSEQKELSCPCPKAVT